MLRPVLSGSKAPGDWWISSSLVRGQSNRRGANVRFGEPNADFGNTVLRDFTPVLAKHSKSFSLIDCISVGVDGRQRNFEPMRKQGLIEHLMFLSAARDFEALRKFDFIVVGKSP